ncbi:hypothetical protein BT96DRAFT_949865 [Gymnopus androsaceus JB14]|uniref:Uncharacterized protein n=1 Tax=Gymnopus androsaceus JB14 TaxID=1447944 RepID=A0A6A4GIL0_9AGAR|nr:hypothetical protein BT96DRAFT_949865 [Gymnopus androsaceus JB14]
MHQLHLCLLLSLPLGLRGIHCTRRFHFSFKALTPPPSTPAINSERTSIAPPPTPPASTKKSSGTPALEERDAVPMLDDQEVSLAAPEAQVVHQSQTRSGKRTIAEITSEVEAPQRVTRARVAAQEVAPKTRASKKAAGNKRGHCLIVAQSFH